MKYTTAAIIVASLFSLSSCHSHRAVESTAGLQIHTETADSVAATRHTPHHGIGERGIGNR